MKIMIELVGEQYLPNVLPVRHYRVEAVLLVYTNRTEMQYQRLKQLFRKETRIEGIKTEAYNIAAIIKQIETALQRHKFSQNDLIFNLTGGTKSMVLAAYQLAAQLRAPVCYLQSEGSQSVIYPYEWNNHLQLEQQDKEELPEYLNLREMLNLTLGEKAWREDGPHKTPRTEQLSEGGLFEKAILDVLRLDPDYEVMCGIKTNQDNVEVDLVIRYQNQLAIIQAKTGKSANKLKGIAQLSIAVRHFGTYTKQFFVVNDNESEDSQTRVREALRINLVPLLQYKKGDTTLTAHDAELLKSTVAQKLKR